MTHTHNQYYWCSNTTMQWNNEKERNSTEKNINKIPFQVMLVLCCYIYQKWQKYCLPQKCENIFFSSVFLFKQDIKKSIKK